MLTLRFYAETDTFPSKSICFGRWGSFYIDTLAGSQRAGMTVSYR